MTKLVELELIRVDANIRNRAPARIAFKAGNAIYGIYWGGDTDGWVPAKWKFPSGDYRNDGRKSDLDLGLSDIWKDIK